jgi:hypothetical protein
LRAEEASKIAPHQLDALLKLVVAMLQIFDVFGHQWILQTKSEIANSEGEFPSLAVRNFLYAASGETGEV